MFKGFEELAARKVRLLLLHENISSNFPDEICQYKR